MKPMPACFQGFRRTAVTGMLLLIFAAGCTRYDEVEQDLGSGLVLVLPVDQAQALGAVRSAIRSERLELEHEDADSGILRVRKGLNWWDWGERMVIRVRPLESERTEVEIVTRASFRFLEAEEDTSRRLWNRLTGEPGITP